MLLSGGIDSATCLVLSKRSYTTRAITFVYHGIADGELRAAKALAEATGVAEHRLVRLPDLKEAADIQGRRFEGLPPTYIPLRNAIFYSLAASYAEEAAADLIIGGHNKDDLETFRDTSTSFFEELESAIWAGSKILAEKRIRILRPLRSRTKPQVIRLAKSIGVPLQMTWSCHRDGREHCWKCDGCLGRERSFLRARVPDPLRRDVEGRKIS